MFIILLSIFYYVYTRYDASKLLNINDELQNSRCPMGMTGLMQSKKNTANGYQSSMLKSMQKLFSVVIHVCAV